jgi:hypothetical protein
MLRCSLVRKGFTLLHIYDTVTRALVSPQAWEAPPPAFGCVVVPMLHLPLLALLLFHNSSNGHSSHCNLLLECVRSWSVACSLVPEPPGGS